MKCPTCKMPNREKAKYCLSCGAILSRPCDACGGELPLHAEFCDICGHRLNLHQDVSSPENPGTAEEGSSTDTKPLGKEEVSPGPSRFPRHASIDPNHPESLLLNPLWRQALYRQETEMLPKSRFFLFLSILYLITMSYMVVTYLHPDNQLSRLTRLVSENVWTSFLILGTLFLVSTWLLYYMVMWLYSAILRKRGVKPNLEEVLLEKGVIPSAELRTALTEKDKKLGEILVQEGYLSPHELERALDRQEELRTRLISVLKELGLVTDRDIRNALNKISGES